jgi:8-oxo-dGTP pyrophosphatase MutT (NUDIX family)
MSLESHPFEQEFLMAQPPIVAVGGVVYRQMVGHPELLLIKKQFGFWTLPKGRVKPGENERDALVREVREETGIYGAVESVVGQVRYIVYKADRPCLKVVTYYVMRAEDGALCPDPAEQIQYVRWFPLQTALRRIRRARVRAVARAARALLEASSD